VLRLNRKADQSVSSRAARAAAMAPNPLAIRSTASSSKKERCRAPPRSSSRSSKVSRRTLGPKSSTTPYPRLRPRFQKPPQCSVEAEAGEELIAV
jgi:hypothetical protein